jgi:hypothetical protein
VELARGGLSLVAQHVVLGDLDEGGRQAAQLFRGGL